MNKKLSAPFAITIIIVIAGFVTFMTWIWSNYATYESNTIFPSAHKIITKNNNGGNLIGGDRDEHGCIGSAGYTWCEEKQKCLRSWEESCASINNHSNTAKTPLDTTNSYNISKWITYTNEKYGYSFKYPNVGWEMYGGDSSGIFYGDNVKEDLKHADHISLKTKISSDHSHDIDVNPQQGSADFPPGSCGAISASNVKEEEVTFLGLDASQVTCTFTALDGKKEYDNEDVTFYKNGYAFSVGGVEKDYLKNGGADEGILNAILATFKFIK